jgi:hypothetical protein
MGLRIRVKLRLGCQDLLKNLRTKSEIRTLAQFHFYLRVVEYDYRDRTGQYHYGTQD